MPGVESVENFLKDRQLLRRLKKEETQSANSTQSHKCSALANCATRVAEDIQSATFYSKSVTELDFSFIDLNTVQSMAVPSAALTKVRLAFHTLSLDTYTHYTHMIMRSTLCFVLTDFVAAKLLLRQSVCSSRLLSLPPRASLSVCSPQPPRLHTRVALRNYITYTPRH